MKTPTSANGYYEIAHRQPMPLAEACYLLLRQRLNSLEMTEALAILGVNYDPQFLVTGLDDAQEHGWVSCYNSRRNSLELWIFDSFSRRSMWVDVESTNFPDRFR